MDAHDRPTPGATAARAAGHRVAAAWALAGPGDRLGAALALVQIVATETSLLALDATLEAALSAGAQAAADVQSLAAQITKATAQAQRLAEEPASGLLASLKEGNAQGAFPRG